MFNVKLDNNDLNNVLQFLDRVQIQGLTEVTAMQKLVGKLRQAEEIVEEATE